MRATQGSRLSTEVPDPTLSLPGDRRDGPDRRRNLFRALWVGSLRPRRRSARRLYGHGVTSVDWHHPQWLAVGLLILLLSCADAFLTLTLINLGANEANPVMGPLVVEDGRSFALWKLALTALGVTVLIVLARARAFGWLPVGLILYAVLMLYICLIGYELWLLEQLSILAI